MYLINNHCKNSTSALLFQHLNTCNVNKEIKRGCIQNSEVVFRDNPGPFMCILQDFAGHLRLLWLELPVKPAQLDPVAISHFK